MSVCNPKCWHPLHVLGCGSVGLLFASSIRKASPTYPVTMLLRSSHKHRLQKFDAIYPQHQQDISKGDFSHEHYIKASLTSTSSNNTTSIVDIPAEIIDRPGEHNALLNDIDHLLLCTKAYDAPSAVFSVLHRLSPNAKITILSNGALAVKKQLDQMLIHTNENVQTILASTTHGAYRPNHQDFEYKNSTLFEVVHAGEGKTYVEDHRLASLFEASNLAGDYVNQQQIHIILWKKLAANCVINPLTALLHCHNGKLSQNKDYVLFNRKLSQLMNDILHEVSEVAATTQANHNDDVSVSSDQLQFQQLQTFVQNVIQNTFHNKSSMLQDVINKRKVTEIDYLNDYVVSLGKRYNISTPVNELLSREIEQLVKSFSENDR